MSTPKRPGRPTIGDGFAAYIYGEAQRRKYPNNSLRQLFRRRGVRYDGTLGGMKVSERNPLRGESLRKLYGDTKRALGLTPPHQHIMVPKDHPLIVHTNALVDQLVRDIFD